MIVMLTPEIKFVCDRCGKEEFPDANGYVFAHEIEFCEHRGPLVAKRAKTGQVCSACATEFWDYANNFFDEVNKDGGVQDE